MAKNKDLRVISIEELQEEVGMLWSKLNSSIGYYINKSVWKDKLIQSNEEILNDYIKYAFVLEDGTYKYLDKKTYEYTDLT